MSGDQTEIHQLSQEVGSLLSSTLSTDGNTVKLAGERLKHYEDTNRLYGFATLYLTRRDDVTPEVKTVSAIAFKNFIKKYWRFDPKVDAVNKIEAQQRDMIKQNIVEFMLGSPEYIQRQLSEAISIIGQCDFPDDWPSLITELEKFLGPGFDKNFNTLQGILQTAHSITRRYRYELQSNRLWQEIKLVVEHFAQPLTDRFKDLNVALKNLTIDSEHLLPVYQSLLLCVKIYRSLISQDLPEFFEDHLEDWRPHLVDLLKIDIKLPNDSPVIEDLKSEICEIAGLFVQSYSDTENFSEYTQKFAENIWNLLVTTSQDIQYDTLVSTAMKYLVIVAARPETRVMFQAKGVLSLLCQNVIVSNLSMREADEELFEDNPEEYVRRDIEGSDVDTRRRAACDLVQVLCKFQEEELIGVLGGYINEALTKYKQDPATHWKLKDFAIFAYAAIAIKGSTRQYGTVSISQHVNIVGFYEDQLINELNAEARTTGAHVIKADVIHYITIFRNYIPKSSHLAVNLPLIMKHITSPSIVVRTYAGIALEKIITMRDPSQPQQPLLKPAEYNHIMTPFIPELFKSLDMPDCPENEHIMKAILQLLSSIETSQLVQYLPTIVPLLTNKLLVVAKNPSKPFFNHHLFQTLELTIKAACALPDPAMRIQYEQLLANIYGVVMSQDVQEFAPYLQKLLTLVRA